MFWRELKGVPAEADAGAKLPVWLTVAHVGFLGLVVATREYQEPLKLREGLLVGFFLAGLVTLGSLQTYCLKPILPLPAPSPNQRPSS